MDQMSLVDRAYEKVSALMLALINVVFRCAYHMARPLFVNKMIHLNLFRLFVIERMLAC